jgi:RimJ/RimL family protein N-acetyltransferase
MLNGQYTYLRAVEESDLGILRDWRNNPDFRKNFREHRELNLENQKKWFFKLQENPNDFMFVIVDKEKHEPIGACGLLYTNWIIRSADFSFYIGKDALYVDEKFAKDAIISLINYGFNDLNLNKLWMELYEYDKKKLDLFLNIFNFKIDGKLRCNAFANGKYWDSYIISLLKDELTSQQNSDILFK